MPLKNKNATHRMTCAAIIGTPEQFDIHLLDMSQEDDAISLGTPDDVDLYIST